MATSKLVVEYIPVRKEGEDYEDANQRVNDAITAFIEKHHETHAIGGPSALAFPTSEPMLEMRAMEKEFRLEAMKQDGVDQVRVQFAQKTEAESLQSGVQTAGMAAMPSAPRPGGFPRPLR